MCTNLITCPSLKSHKVFQLACGKKDAGGSIVERSTPREFTRAHADLYFAPGTNAVMETRGDTR